MTQDSSCRSLIIPAQIAGFYSIIQIFFRDDEIYIGVRASIQQHSLTFQPIWRNPARKRAALAT
jgi:hypothetical protein